MEAMDTTHVVDMEDSPNMVAIIIKRMGVLEVHVM